MCATVTPDEYHLASLALADELNRNSNFKLGVGLHPWWLSDGSCGADAVDKLVAYAAETRFIGEIGLDFAPRRAESAQLQRTVFARIAAASRGKCSRCMPRKAWARRLILWKAWGSWLLVRRRALKTRRVQR